MIAGLRTEISTLRVTRTEPLSKERVSFNPRKTAQANCAEHLQKEKTSLPYRLPAAWTKERLEPTYS
jgi:hypothetical protein